MKRLLALTAALLLCLSLSACVLMIPTELPEVSKLEKVMDHQAFYPNTMTYEDHTTGITTVTEYEYPRNGSVLDLDGVVSVEVFEDDVLVDSYEVQFDKFANPIRIGDTTIEHTYDENGLLVKSVYTESGEVTQIITREYDENNRIQYETFYDGSEVMTSFDLYTFEGDYGSYANVDHHLSDATCTGYSRHTYNFGGALNMDERYDLDGNLLSTTTWLHFSHTEYSYHTVE